MEYFITPKPKKQRPLSAWAIHVGICLLVYIVFLSILLRPWCSFIAVLAIMLTLVLINNTKYRSLKESLTAQDYEFITDIIFHPRLFLPHFGIKKFIQATIFFLIAIIGFILEPIPENILTLKGQGGALLILFCIACLCLYYAIQNPLSTRFEPLEDMQKLGLLATLWVHTKGLQEKPDVSNSPFTTNTMSPFILTKPHVLPHLVAIQSESFFDPRPLFAGIKKDVLQHYDILQENSIQYGSLQVPAWGGNTVRTEFSFLTGLKQKDLGAHRFNPYEITAKGYPIPSLFKYLKNIGYQIICIHPYAAHFYKRDKVFQNWEVDAFLDIKAFANAHHYGSFVSDIELGKMVIKQVEKATKPTIVFAVSMENHGPLHLEKVRNKDIEKLYTTAPPVNWEDMTTYLRHIKHADAMISLLQTSLQNISTPTSLCWYGDHVPIMPNVYASLKTNVSDTSYILWHNDILYKTAKNTFGLNKKHNNPLKSHDLAESWLKSCGY